MRILQHYSEAKQVGILYHFTNLFNLINIVFDNLIKANTQTYELEGRDFSKKIIATTRNYRMISDMPHWANRYCRIALDGDKISNNYKIFPFSDIAIRNNWDEDEEAIVAPKGLILSKYALSIDAFEKELNYDFKTFPKFIGDFSKTTEILKKMGLPFNIVDKWRPY